MLRAVILMSLALLGWPAAAQNAVKLPTSIKLDGMTPAWQQYNRCSAAAFFMQISYYGWDGTYSDIIAALNPHAEDVNVRLEEMVAFAESQDLKGLIRIGGTLGLLKHLVAVGFPVLVENSYYEGDAIPRNWMSHNRVINGYDDALGVIYAFDSLLGFGGDGTGRPIPYEEFDESWRHFNRVYLVLYKPSDEPLLKAVLGDHWDSAYNAERALQQAESELAGNHTNDPYSLFNQGASLYALGDYAAAAAIFDQATAADLPWRFLWYRFEPFEANLQLERYEAVLALTQQVLNTTPGAEEMYYYAGRAYEGLNRTAEAEASYQRAIARNKNYAQAAEALAKLTAEAQEAQT